MTNPQSEIRIRHWLSFMDSQPRSFVDVDRVGADGDDVVCRSGGRCADRAGNGDAAGAGLAGTGPAAVLEDAGASVDRSGA